MSLANGTITKTQVTANSVALAVSNATGGTSPYTYQWYMSTTSGFTPGSGNIISGATSQSVTVTGLVPGRTYYFSNIVTDTDTPTPATAAATQLTQATSILTVSPNQFAQTGIVGQLANGVTNKTNEVKIADTETGTLYPGQAVNIVATSTGGVPEVVAYSASTDNVWGFILYNGMQPYFTAGMIATVARNAGNTVYLMPTTTGNRGSQAVLDITAIGGVAPASGSGGENIVGVFYDKPIAGTLARVEVNTPSFKYDA